METKYSLGIIGLGVMGRSLALNFQRNGYEPIGYDISPKLPPDFIVKTTTSLEELVQSLEPPRILFMMVPAGAPVDSAIGSLKPYLQKGDVVIDGGNSFFEDSNRRSRELEQEGLENPAEESFYAKIIRQPAPEYL